jgi:Mn-dependent DtxR family transcriptional regulator
MRPEDEDAERQRFLRELARYGLLEDRGRGWRLTPKGREALAALRALKIFEHAVALADKPTISLH